VRLRWIVISYFLIGGGIALAAGILMAAWIVSGAIDVAALARLAERAAGDSLEPGSLPPAITGAAIAGTLTFAAGAALGGFFAGRASPHRSYLEPALAAALVVGSVAALIHSTPMGKLAVSFVRAEVEVMTSVLVATGLFAGLVGAVLGELASGNPRSAGAWRQTGIAVLITAGALLAAVTFAAILLINEAAEMALRNIVANQHGREGPLVEVPAGRLIGFAIVAAVAASAIGGAVTQLATAGRSLGPPAVAAGLVLGGLGIALAALAPQIDWLGAAALALGAGAALLAASAAALVRVAGGARRR
jgi:hypothetical protein